MTLQLITSENYDPDRGCFGLLIDISRALLLDANEAKRLVECLALEIEAGAEPEWDRMSTPDLYEVYDIAVSDPELSSVADDLGEWLGMSDDPEAA